MKKLLSLAVLLLLSSFSAFAQEEIEYKEYSYSEFFKMIEQEVSNEFQLSNAFIIPDSLTDKPYYSYVSNLQFDREMKRVPEKDTIVIEKAIRLNNVQFLLEGAGTGDKNPSLSYLHFKKAVNLTNVANFFFASSTFDEHLRIFYTSVINDLMKHPMLNSMDVSMIQHCHFKQGISYVFSQVIKAERLPIIFLLNSSEVSTPANASSMLWNGDFIAFSIYGNKFSGEGDFSISNNGTEIYTLINNHFEGPLVTISQNITSSTQFDISGNTFDHFVALGLGTLPENGTFNWSQFATKSLSSNKIYDGLKSVSDSSMTGGIYNLENIKRFANQKIFEDELYYKQDQKLKGFLMRFYKAQNDLDFANAVFVESKDLETKRLGYLYQTGPTFKTFFSWQINQFLKIFSAYGTEPARAIIFSVYVILAFALVYLFFPNHWDSHGKDRILHRYQFFFKYLNKDAGMHDVYLDGKKDELAHYDGFKNFFIENGKTVPKFFLATALPLYRWSTASTRSSSWFLQKIDIFKGKWADLPAPQRAAKTMLLTLAFAIALLYDIFIKMLNALMLSINTFTTLGFGEIPIKGLPRYLAIIQGFIGWFMLTIFSVSLISQLLN